MRLLQLLILITSCAIYGSDSCYAYNQNRTIEQKTQDIFIKAYPVLHLPGIKSALKVVTIASQSRHLSNDKKLTYINNAESYIDTVIQQRDSVQNRQHRT